MIPPPCFRPGCAGLTTAADAIYSVDLMGGGNRRIARVRWLCPAGHSTWTEVEAPRCGTGAVDLPAERRPRDIVHRVGPAERACGCGCGAMVPSGHARKYASARCEQRARRARQKTEAGGL